MEYGIGLEWNCLRLLSILAYSHLLPVYNFESVALLRMAGRPPVLLLIFGGGNKGLCGCFCSCIELYSIFSDQLRLQATAHADAF